MSGHSGLAAGALALLLADVAACTPAGPTTTNTPTTGASGSAGATFSFTPTPSPSMPPSPSAPTVLTPVLIDTDMALDDIIAIAVLLRDPALSVRSVTVSGTGEAHCPTGATNAARLLAAFGRTDVQVACGRDTPGTNGRAFPDAWRQDADNMYGLDLSASQAAIADAPTLINETAADADGRLTIVAIGPWTNLADAFAADPALSSSITGIHAMGGTFDGNGNLDLGQTHIWHQVEWNLGADPAAVAAVLPASVPITLVPLDATNDVQITDELTKRLQPDHAAAGADILYQLLQTTPLMTSGLWFLWDPLAALTLTQPNLADWEDTAIRFETEGVSAGRIVRTDGGRNVHAATAANAPAAFEALITALRRGEPLLKAPAQP
jgi:inosine-uridine nucleoside N-ribohydrolase